MQSMLDAGRIGIVNDSVQDIDYWTYNSNVSLSSTATVPEIPQCKDLNPYVLKGDGWIPQHIEIADRAVYTCIAIYMTFLFLFSTSFNGIVIAATYKFRVLRQPLNYIIVNLAVADFLGGGVGGFLSILTNASGYFFLGKGLCYAEGYAVSLFGCAGLNSIAVMAFERYFVICKPFGPVKVGAKAAAAGIFVAWAWSFFWNTPPLILWDGYEPEGLGTTCAPSWFVTEDSQRLFIILYFVFAFLFPYAIIAVCYGKLILELRQIAKESSLSGSKSPEKEVTKMVVIMVAAFVLCWLPYASFAMYNAVNPTAQMSYGLGAIPAFFAKSATIYNPIIYVKLNRQFRDCVIRMFFSGRNPWSDEGATSSMASVNSSQVTTVSTNKVGPA
ncbi:unnamed protein product [Clavelina lepadiformis]|uniref:G-protein coupled receptors family 1 profile domain-containing protein n=1 Tax=Clavelina lepadiformis TaxID=159417 RepID=A0ABP0H2X9_CLALP